MGGENTFFQQQLLASFFTHFVDGPILQLCRKQWEAAATSGAVRAVKALDSEGGSDNFGEKKMKCFTGEPKPHIPSSPEQLPGAESPALLGDWLNKKLHFCFPFSFPPSAKSC